MEIKTYKVGRLFTNCYLLVDNISKCAVMIDPGAEIDGIEDQISGLNLKYILLTHGHFDHILKAKKYRDVFGAKVVISRLESEFTVDGFLNLSDRFLKPNIFESFNPDTLVDDEDELYFGKYKIKVLSTPGHTVGSLYYIIDNNIFSGDTLFKNQCGCTRFPTGSEDKMENSLKKLYSLEGDFNVYPGHGESTILSAEKNNHTGL